MTRAQLLEGFGHPDIFVRSPILKYFGDSQDQGTDVTRAAIATVERHGWNDAFEWPHQIAALAVDQEAGRWLVAELLREGATAAGLNTKGHLMRWFGTAPLDVVEGLLGEVTGSPLWGRDAEIFGLPQSGLKRMPAQERVEFRLALSTTSPGQCMDQLEDALSRAAAAESFPDVMVERLGLIGDRHAEMQSRIREIVMSWLNGAGPDLYRAGLGIRLAGNLKLDAAIPRFLEMFSFEWDWWNESIQAAIVAMGTPEALAAAIAGYPKAEFGGKHFLASAMGDLRFPHMQADLLELLRAEEDEMLRTSLGFALARYGTPTAMAAARGVIDDWPEDADRFSIAEILYAFRTLLGEDDAAMQGWRAQFEQWRIQERFMLDGLRVVLEQPFEDVGRNDP
ncbi:MAG TPA: hypothetical protein VMN36_07745 [Verrucomicrobiales bacterium]|nr:hypothetical protein [Verrucomicrobiales bacterium]